MSSAPSASITPANFESFAQHGCPGCGSPIPLEDVEDRRVRSRSTGERRRKVSISCCACGRTYTARFRIEGGIATLINQVKVTSRVRVFVPAPRGLMTDAKFDRPRNAVKKAFRDAERASCAAAIAT